MYQSDTSSEADNLISGQDDLRSLSDHEDDIFINLNNDDEKEIPKSEATKKEQDLLAENMLYQEESTYMTDAPNDGAADPKE